MTNFLNILQIYLYTRKDCSIFKNIFQLYMSILNPGYMFIK